MFFKKKKECPVCKTPLDKAKAALSELAFEKSIEIKIENYNFRVSPTAVYYYKERAIDDRRYSHWDDYRHLTENDCNAMVVFTENYEKLREMVKIEVKEERRQHEIEEEKERQRKKKIEECEIKLLEMIEDDGKG